MTDLQIINTDLSNVFFSWLDLKREINDCTNVQKKTVLERKIASHSSQLRSMRATNLMELALQLTFLRDEFSPETQTNNSQNYKYCVDNIINSLAKIASEEQKLKVV